MEDIVGVVGVGAKEGAFGALGAETKGDAFMSASKFVAGAGAFDVGIFPADGLDCCNSWSSADAIILLWCDC